MDLLSKNTIFVSLRAWRRLAALLSLTFLAATAPSTSLAYVLPAEQLVEFMQGNFSKFRVWVVTQSVQAVSSDENEAAQPSFREEIESRAPDSIHVRRLIPAPTADGEGGPGNGPEPGSALSEWARSDRSFLRLLMSGGQSRMLDFLRKWGIAVESVSYTREEEVIAFRIGNRVPGEPVLVLEKERFLPMFLCYRPMPGSEGDHKATVRFLNYRAVAGGWFPYEIHVTTMEGRTFRCTLEQLAINGSVFSPGTHEWKPRPSDRTEDRN